ncbi:MAG: phasin family protein [Casimicrobiaceae bacterium]
MATKTASKRSSRKTAGSTQRAASGAGTRAAADGGQAGRAAADAFKSMTDPAQFAKLREMMTPEQAFEMYRQNARLALEIIDAAVESTAKMRKLQFAGEEEARAFQKRAARRAAEAENPQALVATSQHVSQEAMQSALAYWSQMFELVVEMQKRLFHIIDDQTKDLPGMKEAKVAMSMLPDMSQTQKLVSAMQGVLSSGGPAFESMQRVMNDFTRMAQQSMPGNKR